MLGRTLTLLAGFLVLSGCFSFGAKNGLDVKDPVVAPLDPATVRAEGATIEAAGAGVRVTWAGQVQGEATHKVTIPPQALIMRARFELDAGPGQRGFTFLEPTTGVDRCPRVGSLLGSPAGKIVQTCTGVTFIDTDGVREASYDIHVQGCRPANSADTSCASAPTPKYSVLVEFLPGPLDGPASVIDLAKLSTSQYKLLPQKTDYVKATSDGARLFVEVNLPDGPGPWPTILISSPYNQPDRDAGRLTQGARVRDFVPRGYAVVVADVRGFANSEGCVEIWGPKEQKDQVDLVEWVAKQPWSNGKVGMYGQSYVGTTPHEAAVNRAPHLTTIATVAGLTDPYFDWHFGGVPNGESFGSPAGYHVLTAAVPPRPTGFVNDPLGFATLARSTGCDLATNLAEANNPNAVYGAYYKQRNLSDNAANIIVPVLYTQGYIDTNVKVSQALDFFNAIKTPKLGVFGPWLHRHPPRGDFDLILHAWMDRWLQGRETRVETMPDVQSITNRDTLRTGTTWPPLDTNQTILFPGGAAGTLSPERPSAKWEGNYQAGVGPGAVQGGTEVFRFRSEPLADRLYIAGEPRLDFTARLESSTNQPIDTTHFGAALYDEAPDGKRLRITFGMFNACLYKSYQFCTPLTNTDMRYQLPFLPTEYVVEPGHRLVLTFGPAASAFSLTKPVKVFVSTGQQDATRLVLPSFAEPKDEVAPISVFGFDAFR